MRANSIQSSYLEGAGFWEERLLPERICGIFVRLIGVSMSFVTYVLRHVCAFRDIAASRISQTLVPDQILSAVEAAPVPVSPHHSTDEVGVVRVRSIVVVEVTRLDIVGGRRDCSGSKEDSECSKRFHVCRCRSLEGTTKVYGYEYLRVCRL